MPNSTIERSLRKEENAVHGLETNFHLRYHKPSIDSAQFMTFAPRISMQVIDQRLYWSVLRFFSKLMPSHPPSQNKCYSREGRGKIERFIDCSSVSLQDTRKLVGVDNLAKASRACLHNYARVNRRDVALETRNEAVFEKDVGDAERERAPKCLAEGGKRHAQRILLWLASQCVLDGDDGLQMLKYSWSDLVCGWG
jgi:hypothetical protein